MVAVDARHRGLARTQDSSALSRMSMRRHLSWRARQGSQRLREGSRRVAVTCWGDCTTLKLVPLKLTFFIIMGATQCMSPFIPLLVKALGFKLLEAGIIFAIGPLIPIVAPLIANLIADKLGNFRCILVFTVALSGFVALINMAIPPARTTPSYSDTLSFGITCSPDFVLTPQLSKEDECDFLDKTVDISSVEAKNCGYKCSPRAVSIPHEVLKHVKKLRLKQVVNDTMYHICKVKLNEDKTEDQKCFRVNLNKSLAHENMPKAFQIHNLELPLAKKTMINDGFPVTNYTMRSSDLNSFECYTGKVPKNVKIPKLTISEETPPLKDEMAVTCEFHCHASIAHNLTCKDRAHSVEHNVALSLWFFVSINALNKFLIGLTYTLFEVAVVAVLREHDNDYGLQRIYGSIGGMMFAPLSGFLIDYFAKNNYKDFYVMFVLYCALKMLCALMLVKLHLGFKTHIPSARKNRCKVLTNLEVLLLLLIVFIAGMCYGFIKNLLPWHLDTMKAPKWFIGLLTTVASLSALPFLGFSGSICKKFGYFQSIAFGLVCYSIRFIGYSLVKKYYWVAPFEVLEGVTTGLLFTAAVVYGGQLSSRSNLATLQGILATCHYGLGKSAGSMLGSFLMHHFKTPIAFQIFSGLSLISAFFYYLVGKLVILPRHNKIMQRRKAVMKMPIETISRNEYKKRNKLYSLPEVETYRLSSKKKGQSPMPPRENDDTTVEENGNLNQTQMTELPPDEVSVQNITAEDIPTNEVSPHNSTATSVPDEEGSDKLPPGEDKPENSPSENSPSEKLSCENNAQDPHGELSDQRLPNENKLQSHPTGDSIPDDNPNPSSDEASAQDGTNMEAKSES
ncbi:hypothetical protein Pmani_017736 [Petrolisthes manimaculis]|uniref:Major facilitator superfamily associated domain-containing protein n=1 Tax=Petrolisthes manimaculis TaxID=1843537 RepID=A0AAE1PP48_9EUCA|nr:hypothetical protein Pmani_017736 [Petrolisthes manimaculis]